MVLYWYLRAKLFSFFDTLFFLRHFDLSFVRLNWYLWRAFFLFSPYRLCRKYWQQRDESGVYGETPLYVWKRLGDYLKMGKDQVLVDLGAGRGRGCFWFSKYFGVRVIGVEAVPCFVKVAQNLSAHFGFDRVSFFEADLLNFPLKGADCLYLYATGLSEPLLKKFCEKLKKENPSARVLTVSVPLRELDDDFESKLAFTAQMPWGKAYVFDNTLSPATA